MIRAYWLKRFAQEDFETGFPCSNCDGHMAFRKSSIKVVEPTYSKIAEHSPEWEPDHRVERFAAVFRCTRSQCGEVMVVLGDIEREKMGWEYEIEYVPYAMHPPSPVITIPRDTPLKVRREIESAFAAIWVDEGISASRLRTSVENLLDHNRIPRSRKTKNGSSYMTLHSRIELFAKKSPQHSSCLHALRVIGNLGTHTGGVTRPKLLDAFELYEDGLAEIVGQRTKRMARLAKGLGRTKKKSKT